MEEKNVYIHEKKEIEKKRKKRMIIQGATSCSSGCTCYCTHHSNVCADYCTHHSKRIILYVINNISSFLKEYRIRMIG